MCVDFCYVNLDPSSVTTHPLLIEGVCTFVYSLYGYAADPAGKTQMILLIFMPFVPEEDCGTRAAGKSRFKSITLLIFTHSFSLDIYPSLVGVALRLETRRGEIAGQHADTQNSCFSIGNPYSILLRI